MNHVGIGLSQTSKCKSTDYFNDANFQDVDNNNSSDIRVTNSSLSLCHSIFANAKELSKCKSYVTQEMKIYIQQ